MCPCGRHHPAFVVVDARVCAVLLCSRLSVHEGRVSVDGVFPAGRSLPGGAELDGRKTILIDVVNDHTMDRGIVSVLFSVMDAAIYHSLLMLTFDKPAIELKLLVHIVREMKGVRIITVFC